LFLKNLLFPNYLKNQNFLMCQPFQMYQLFLKNH
jgi:hypothetical protein